MISRTDCSTVRRGAYKLKIAIGCPVRVNYNIDIPEGIVNGALGTVVGFHTVRLDDEDVTDWTITTYIQPLHEKLVEASDDNEIKHLEYSSCQIGDVNGRYSK